MCNREFLMALSCNFRTAIGVNVLKTPPINPASILASTSLESKGPVTSNPTEARLSCPIFSLRVIFPIKRSTKESNCRFCSNGISSLPTSQGAWLLVWYTFSFSGEGLVPLCENKETRGANVKINSNPQDLMG